MIQVRGTLSHILRLQSLHCSIWKLKYDALTSMPSFVSGRYSEGPGIGGRIILRWIFRKWDVRAWTESMWLRIGTGCGLLLTR
jgi:hypothetical protein